MGFAPEDYIIKRLKENKMAECLSQEGIIVINPDIVKYSKETIEYIIIHEFCHLKYKTHSKKFYELEKKYIGKLAEDREIYKNIKF